MLAAVAAKVASTKLGLGTKSSLASLF